MHQRHVREGQRLETVGEGLGGRAAAHGQVGTGVRDHQQAFRGEERRAGQLLHEARGGRRLAERHDLALRVGLLPRRHGILARELEEEIVGAGEKEDLG